MSIEQETSLDSVFLLLHEHEKFSHQMQQEMLHGQQLSHEQLLQVLLDEYKIMSQNLVLDEMESMLLRYSTQEQEWESAQQVHQQHSM